MLRESGYLWWIVVVLLYYNTCKAQQNNELAAVYKDKSGDYGYISPEGKILIPAQYKDAKPFSAEGMALVKVKKANPGGIRYGFIDKTGKFIVEPVYYSASEFKDGLALVRVKKDSGELRYGYIDRTGKFVIEPIYIYASEFSEGLAAVQLSKKLAADYDPNVTETLITWAYIDKTGKIIIEESQLRMPSRVSMLGNFYNGVAAVSVFEFTETYYVNRKKLLPADSLKINNGKETNSPLGFSEGLAAVQKGPLSYEYIDTKGATVIRKNFTKAGGFREGLAIVEINKQTAFIDKQGEIKFTVNFKYVDNSTAVGFKNGYFTFISPEGKYGVINKLGKVVINPEYEFIGEFN